MFDLKNKLIYQIVLALSQVLFPIVSIPIVSSNIGPEGLGKIGFIEYLTGLVFTIFSFGVSYYGTREVARKRSNQNELSSFTSELTTLHLILVSIGLPIFIILSSLNLDYKSDPELMILGCVYLLSQVFSFEWYLNGLEDFRFIAKRNILTRLLGLALIILLVKKKEDYLLYYSIIVTTQLAISIGTFFYIKSNTNIKLSIRKFKTHTKSLYAFAVTSSAISIYVFFDTIILSFYENDDRVGFYTLAIKIAKLPLLFLLILNNLLFPRLSFYAANNYDEHIKTLQKNTLNFLILITLPLCSGIYALAPEIIRLIAGKEFESSIDVLKILSPIPFIVTLINFISLQILFPRKKETKFAVTTFIGAIVSIILFFILIPIAREKGAAIATLSTESAILIICTISSWKYISELICIKSLCYSIILSIIPVLIAIIISRFLFSDLYNIITTSLVSAFIYFFIQIRIIKNKYALIYRNI